MNKSHLNIPLSCLSLFTCLNLLLFVPVANAGRAVRNWQTTKTTALGGAGIAAPTMIEGLYLNPAMFAFFSNSSFYFQNKDSSLDPVNATRSTQFGNSKPPKGFSAAINDGSNSSKGGFSYTDQEESGTKRKKYSFGFGNTIDGNSSLGVSYSYVQDEFMEGNSELHNKLHVGSIGYMNILSPQLSLAIVWNDPAWADRLNSKTVVGVHYAPFERLNFLLDFGQDIKRSLNKTLYYAIATEIEFYTDLYARFGMFQDKVFNLEGQGMGIGWVGPRLGLEFAMKTSKRKDNFNTFLLPNEKLKETELSLVYLF